MKGQRTLIVVLIVGLLLGLTVGMNMAQEPDPQDDTGPAGVQDGQPTEGQEPDPGDVTSPEEASAVSAIVPIQGRLTDASGNSLDGYYSVTARIYDVSSGGAALCEDGDTVTVDNGLFNMNMDYCSAEDISGEQLYLGITVGTDGEMTPRRPIYPVPYAWTVKPGAIIRGATSYVYTPGSAFVKQNSVDSTRWDLYGSGARIYRGAVAGSKYIRIPITLPAVLYGRNVRVTEARVEYRCQDGTDNYISRTLLYKMSDPDSFDLLFDSTTPHTSSTAAAYTLSTDSNFNTLSSTQGSLALVLQLAFANDTEYVLISGVRLTVVTDY
jgi:hypothetical protein